MKSSRPALAVAEDTRIQLFDLQRQRARLEGDIRRRMDAVLAHGQFILGPEVTQLEQKLAAFAGAGHAIGVSSGRDALTIAMMAMGVKAGDAVFVPAFTFAASAASVVSVGATPVFVDVLAGTFNIDPADLERAIEETAAAGTLQPRAVMPVDLFGLPADYTAIAPIAARHGIAVLADAAQAFGGAAGNKRVGALAPISATSFYPTKSLGCYGDGGAILAEDADLAENVRMIRSHGRAGDGDQALVLGLTGRLDTLQAAILLAKLEVWDDEVAARGRIGGLYTDALRGACGVPEVAAGNTHVYAQYTVRVPQRDRVADVLKTAGIPTAVHYPKCLHEQPVFAPLGYRLGDFPESERAAREVLSLPMHPYLDEAAQRRVVTGVLSAVKTGGG